MPVATGVAGGACSAAAACRVGPEDIPEAEGRGVQARRAAHPCPPYLPLGRA